MQKKWGRYPIVQAVIGGATPELAAAVARTGGLGGMGMTWSPEAEVCDHIAAILQVAGNTPVLVAEGLSGGKDLRKVLAVGASGGVFGTRFVASKEYPAHARMHERTPGGAR